MLDTKNINPQTTSDPADIGKRIQEARKRKGLNQMQLAKELGIGVSTLRLYERGDRTAPIPVLVKICRFFDISADWLLGLPKQEDTEASKVIDELFKLAIIGNLATAARKAGVTMEPELVNGMRSASLKKINEIANAFPAYITAALLARDIKEDEEMYFEKILNDFDAIVFFDTETSGLEPLEHQIIELAAIRVVRTQTGALRIEDKMDDFIRLPEGEQLRPEITELTHITDAMLQEEGKDPAEVAARFHRLIEGTGTKRRVLLAAHNAQFDLLFTRQLLKGHRLGVELKFLDTLTVYKDRAAYPHKLEAAIRHYKLESKVQNSHRAIDDVCALLEVTKAMDEERADIHTYINVFGYNPKYGISGEKIAGITYHAQDFTKFKRPERLTLPALAK